MFVITSCRQVVDPDPAPLSLCTQESDCRSVCPTEQIHLLVFSFSLVQYLLAIMLTSCRSVWGQTV